MKQSRIPAVYMRGGTSKGVFFVARDLPSEPEARDRILMRVIGSPDRYGKHTDGMGGAMGDAATPQEATALARIFSMGVLHHAMTGTGAVAIAAAAAIPGTIVHRVSPVGADGRVHFGHPSGTLKVGAEVRKDGNRWRVTKVMMSRSARRLMEGWVRVPVPA